MQGARFFIDSNVLLYSHDRQSGDKERLAKHWLNELAGRRSACINLQVLNELTYVLLRKKWFGTVEAAYVVVDAFSELGDSPLTYWAVHRARDIHSEFGYSWWDCLLLASASELACSFFLSEDLQDGQTIEGLTIVNPFAHSPEQILNSR
ncbi:PIN domain-containing protein [Mesorhizobium sp. CC13]|uniref:PIN domain-containing protein n=1 Tax=Mesorhizobium sp. CC13 TaxID=3029194 RepID=UPI003263944C